MGPLPCVRASTVNVTLAVFLLLGVPVAVTPLLSAPALSTVTTRKVVLTSFVRPRTRKLPCVAGMGAKFTRRSVPPAAFTYTRYPATFASVPGVQASCAALSPAFTVSPVTSGSAGFTVPAAPEPLGAVTASTLRAGTRPTSLPLLTLRVLARPVTSVRALPEKVPSSGIPPPLRLPRSSSVSPLFTTNTTGCPATPCTPLTTRR